MEIEKEESRYYTPNIRELYPGMEIEFRNYRIHQGMGLYQQMVCQTRETKWCKNWQKGVFCKDLVTKEIKHKPGEFTMALLTEALTSIEERTYPNYDNIKNYIKNKKIRIKYLDVEDIESLGWENGTGRDIGMYIIPNKIDRGHYWLYVLEEDKIMIYKQNPIAEYDSEFCGRWEYNPKIKPLFWGKVKNKGELRKIMEMLNIKGKKNGYNKK